MWTRNIEIQTNLFRIKFCQKNDHNCAHKDLSQFMDLLNNNIIQMIGNGKNIKIHFFETAINVWDDWNLHSWSLMRKLLNKYRYWNYSLSINNNLIVLFNLMKEVVYYYVSFHETLTLIIDSLSFDIWIVIELIKQQ